MSRVRRNRSIFGAGYLWSFMFHDGNDNIKILSNSSSPLIIRSFHLSYLPSESTLSRISLFLEASPTGFFAGDYIIANHKRAVVCYRLRQFFRVLCERFDSRCNLVFQLSFAKIGISINANDNC